MSIRSTVFAFVIILSTHLSFAAVLGDAASLEPNLERRGDLVFHAGFEESALGSPEWTRAWGIGFSQRIESTELLSGKEALLGEKSLRVTYPAGGVGPGTTGAQFAMSFDRMAGAKERTYDSLCLRYYVMFEEGFDFNQGGKLPGLMSGGDGWKITGGHLPDGSNGWTLRYMWRKNGEAVIYAYLPPGKYQTGVWGHDITLGRHFKPGQWHCLEQQVTLNEVGKANGRLSVWFDGEKVIDLSDIVYRTVDNEAGRIGGIYFSTFHGGNSPDWAPARTCHARFDGFVVAKNPIGLAAGVPIEKVK